MSEAEYKELYRAFFAVIVFAALAALGLIISGCSPVRNIDRACFEIRLVRDLHEAESAMVHYRLKYQIAYALLASGHLPLDFLYAILDESAEFQREANSRARVNMAEILETELSGPAPPAEYSGD